MRRIKATDFTYHTSNRISQLTGSRPLRQPLLPELLNVARAEIGAGIRK